MSVIATIEVPAEEFVLSGALASNPGVRVDLERLVPVGDATIPYVWASDDTAESVVEAIESADDVTSVDVVDAVNGEVLVRVEWTPERDGYLVAVHDAGGHILDGYGQADSWRLRLRFDSSEDLSEFYRRCRADGLTLDVEAVHQAERDRGRPRSIELSEAQREALEVALVAGYFDVPRGIDLVGLAEQLGVSDSAVSQRLRRGIEAVLAATLAESDGPDRH